MHVFPLEFSTLEPRTKSAELTEGLTLRIPEKFYHTLELHKAGESNSKFVCLRLVRVGHKEENLVEGHWGGVSRIQEAGKQKAGKMRGCGLVEGHGGGVSRIREAHKQSAGKMRGRGFPSCMSGFASST